MSSVGVKVITETVDDIIGRLNGEERCAETNSSQSKITGGSLTVTTRRRYIRALWAGNPEAHDIIFIFKFVIFTTILCSNYTSVKKHF